MRVQSSFLGDDFWIANEAVNFYVDASQQPTVDLIVDAAHAQFVAVTATLTGYYVSLP